MDIRDLTLTGGSGHDVSGTLYGGAIFANVSSSAATTVTLANVTLDNNGADRGGAVALLNASTLSGANVTMSNNSAGGRGGAIYATSTADAVIAGLVANGNTAGSVLPAVNGEGGAFWLGGSSVLDLTNPRVYDNEAVGGNGGGAYLNGGSLDCVGTAGSGTLYGLFRNTAGGEGGGVYINASASGGGFALSNSTCDYGANGGADDNTDGDGDSQDDVDGASLSNGDDRENDVNTDY